jgi:hypothetical protein
MRFMELPEGERTYLHKIAIESAEKIGGVNFFLSMVEEIRAEKPSILLNERCKFHHSHGSVNWNKQIFRDTYHELLESVKRESRDGDIFAKVQPKDYKRVMNAIRVLKPIKIEFSGEDDSFSVEVIDTSTPKKSRISTLFKMIFIYDLGFLKKSLTYKVNNEPKE